MRSLSVVVPAYNELPTLAEVLRRVLASEALSLADWLQIVVVDDASRDGTQDLVASLAGDWRAVLGVSREDTDRAEVVALLHPTNRGKGAGLRTGFAAANGDYTLVQDADFEYDPRDYARVLRPLWEGRADVVYGSRFLPSERRVLLFWHSVGNGLITLCANMATDLNLSDVETGYKAFRTDVVRRFDIESERFGVEIEITAKVARMGCRVFEVPIAYNGRGYDEGKKITWKDGVEAMVCIGRFGPGRAIRAKLGRPDTR
jgi:glycosyltransferase involved in cell wall biosynthesis